MPPEAGTRVKVIVHSEINPLVEATGDACAETPVAATRIHTNHRRGAGCAVETCRHENLKWSLFIFKDLQDSGRRAAIIGQLTLQPGNFQDVTNIGNAREQSKNVLPETDGGKKPNIYTKEHNRNDVGVCHSASASVELNSDLLEVIDAWQNLPDSVRAGIVAMVKAASANG